MAFENIPLKSIQADIISVVGVGSLPWNDPSGYPIPPGNPPPVSVPRDYRWNVVMDISIQTQSSYITRDPGSYNGQDVVVGMWMANTSTGQAWQIIQIDSKTLTQVSAIVQDIYRYNTFRDSSQTGSGGPTTGTYIIFNISDDGLPIIDPVPPSGVSSSFGINLQSRFEYINLQYDYPLYSAGNTFAMNDVIAANPTTHTFVLSNSIYRTAIGRITSISDIVPGWFTINPVQKIVDNLDYLPGDVSDTIYTSLTNPGQITITPGGTALYIKLRNNTQSISYSTAQGPTTLGNTFQLNGMNVIINGAGTLADLVTATNLVQSNTGVSSSLVLDVTQDITNPTLLSSLYGEVLLWVTGVSPSVTINGVLVTFSIPSINPGYTNYAQPPQLAQSINNASIPNIVASVSGSNLVVTNTAGGAISIVNISNDINGIPFAGSNSGSGLVFSVPAATTHRVRFIATDARAINFLDNIGTPTLDFGLISVENGIKACGLYIAEGLRQASSTVVANLTDLYSLSPMIGDQAYVIDSNDGNGNNVNEWSLWLFDGSSWVETGNQDSSTTDAKSLEYTLIQNGPSLVNIGSISTGRRVTLITVEVVTPFNGLATLSIGYAINNPLLPAPVPNGLMDSGFIDLTFSGTYSTTSDILFGTDTVSGDVTITATFTNAGSSAGEAKIVVSYV